VANWASVHRLHWADAKSNLIKANELSNVTNASCPVNIWPNNTHPYGEYDPVDCSWSLRLEHAICCPRQGFPGGGCNGLPPCIVLVVDKPQYDEGVNEHMVAELAAGQTHTHNFTGDLLTPPGIQIVYAS
jgi:hypothetical protein